MIETTATLVENNAIGTNIDGTASPLIQPNGVVISGPPNALLGTTLPGGVMIQANVISGNLDSGIYLEGNASNEQISGNFIGTDATGRNSLPNGNGVVVTGPGGNMIGGTSPADRNVISGNAGSGISIAGGSAGNTAIGNFIGTDFSGEHATANDVGITIDAGSGNVIGGAAPGDANIISGNSSIGIQISNSKATGNVVLGDLIGVNQGGTRTLTSPDAKTGFAIGILIDDSPANTIGGTALTAMNVIAGFGVGIDISGFDATGNLVENAQIGTGQSKHQTIAGSIGIGVYIDDVASNTVGGSIAGAENTIVGYTTYGVFIYGGLAAHNVVQGNQIGIAAGKTGELAGIAVEDASNNTLGGSTPSAGNTISGNSYAGIYIFGQGSAGASGNEIDHNRLQRNGYGILLYNATNNGGYQTLLSRNRYGGTGSPTSASSWAPSRRARRRLIRLARRRLTRRAITSWRIPGGCTISAPGWSPLVRRSRRPIGRAGVPLPRNGARSAVRPRRMNRYRHGSVQQAQPSAVPRGPLAHRARAIRNPVRSSDS